MDSQEAMFATIGKRIKELFTIYSSLPRKDDPSFSKKINDYYNNVAELIKEKSKELKIKNIIVAGPGFSAEELLKYSKIKALKAHTNHIGRAGIRELIKSKIIEKFTKESEISKETELINEFFTLVAKNKLSKYGLEEVKKALYNGAVKILLISEGTIIRSKQRKTFKELKSIINMAEKTGAKVKFISTKHDAGHRFFKFGGIGAILRFEI